MTTKLNISTYDPLPKKNKKKIKLKDIFIKTKPKVNKKKKLKY